MYVCTVLHFMVYQDFVLFYLFHVKHRYERKGDVDVHELETSYFKLFTFTWYVHIMHSSLQYSVWVMRALFEWCHRSLKTSWKREVEHMKRSSIKEETLTLLFLFLLFPHDVLGPLKCLFVDQLLWEILVYLKSPLLILILCYTCV